MTRRLALFVTLAVLAVALSVGVISGTGGSTPASSGLGPGTPISDGFTVAADTSLVSPAMPSFPPIDPQQGSLQRSWNALLDVQVDAKTALNVYIEQARDIGFAHQPVAAQCNKIVKSGGASCGATLARNHNGLVQIVFINVTVCKRCAVPLSFAKLRLLEVDPTRAANPDNFFPAAPATRSQPTATLSAAERAAAAASVRRANQTRRVTPPDHGKIVDGSELVAPVMSFGGCQGDWTAVYRVTGDQTTVFDAYLEGLEAMFGPAARRIPSKVDGARAMRLVYDDGPGVFDVTLLASTPAHDAYLWAENCSD